MSLVISGKPDRNGQYVDLPRFFCADYSLIRAPKCTKNHICCQEKNCGLRLQKLFLCKICRTKHPRMVFHSGAFDGNRTEAVDVARVNAAVDL